MQCCQRIVRDIGVFIRQHLKIETLGGDFAREALQGLDLGRRQSEPAETLSAGVVQRVVMKWIERGRQARPDRGGAGRRQLLAADDCRQAGKTGRAPPQRGHARKLQDGLQPRILLDQRGMAPSRSAWVLRWTVIWGINLLVSSCAGLTRDRSHIVKILHKGWRSLRRQTTMPGNDECENQCRLVLRFAPSPNGYLHLGHAYSALLNFDLAGRTGGGLLLRIEDIDATRCKPEFETAIYEDLAWLGIAWEIPVRRQSEQLAAYRKAIETL